MAQGALKNAKVSISVAVTGVAGSTGGTQEKPVGIVHLATATHNDYSHQQHIFTGDRTEVRNKTINTALNMLIKAAT